MAKEILFGKEINRLIIENIEIFSHEYPKIRAKVWNDFKVKPNCKCRGKILTTFKKNFDKFNQILSKLMGEEVIIYFVGPLEEPIVKEFKDLRGIEDFLKDLRKKGKIVRSATPSPNGKGGFIVIFM